MIQISNMVYFKRFIQATTNQATFSKCCEIQISMIHSSVANTSMLNGSCCKLFSFQIYIQLWQSDIVKAWTLRNCVFPIPWSGLLSTLPPHLFPFARGIEYHEPLQVQGLIRIYASCWPFVSFDGESLVLRQKLSDSDNFAEPCLDCTAYDISSMHR